VTGSRSRTCLRRTSRAPCSRFHHRTENIGFGRAGARAVAGRKYPLAALSAAGQVTDRYRHRCRYAAVGPVQASPSSHGDPLGLAGWNSYPGRIVGTCVVALILHGRSRIATDADAATQRSVRVQASPSSHGEPSPCLVEH